MANLKEYLVANAVRVEIRCNKVVDYLELGKVLTDYSGRDLINEGNKYVIVNGDIKPSDLDNFEILNKEFGYIIYLYNISTFDQYIRNNKNTFGLYAYQLICKTDLTDEEIKEAFKMFFRNDIEDNVKKLSFMPK